jgi:hypothetical protein
MPESAYKKLQNIHTYLHKTHTKHTYICKTNAKYIQDIHTCTYVTHTVYNAYSLKKHYKPSMNQKNAYKTNTS